MGRTKSPPDRQNIFKRSGADAIPVLGTECVLHSYSVEEHPTKVTTQLSGGYRVVERQVVVLKRTVGVRVISTFSRCLTALTDLKKDRL